MAPKSVTFRRHDHLVSVLFGDLLSHSHNNTFSMFLYLVTVVFADFTCDSYQHIAYWKCFCILYNYTHFVYAYSESACTVYDR